jgi:hypothetical protein
VTTVKITLLHQLRNLCTAVAARPKTGYPTVLVLTTAAGTGNAAWSVAIRKSMTVPAFHDRWPLCSTT